MRRVKQFIGREMWMFSENMNIPLGRFAPVVFGWMMDNKGKKQE